MPKHVSNAVSGRPGKILVTLEDFTSLRGEELLQGIYFVVFGFNLTHKANPWIQPMETAKIPLVSSGNNTFENYFFGWRTNLFQVHKGKKHIFPDGLPLYYEKAGALASVYIAAFEADKIKEQDQFRNDFSTLAGKMFTDSGIEAKKRIDKAIVSLENINMMRAEFGKETLEVKEEIPTESEVSTPIKTIGRKTKPPKPVFNITVTRASNFTLKPQDTLESDRIQDEIKNEAKVVKNAFGMLIKAFETQALLANHQIRYTNVFTFREEEEWLEGGHKDWGDHRMALSINVDTE